MPWIERRGNSVRVRWDTLRTDPDTGRKIFDSKSRTDWTEDEAYKYGLDRESEARNGKYIAKADGRVKFKDWASMWLATQELDPTSIHVYHKRLRAQLLPEWGETYVNEISSLAYLAWMQRLKRKYSENYVRDMRILFSMLMDDAVTCQPPLIHVSPIPKQNRRRGRYVRPVREKKVEVPTADLHQLADNAHEVWGFTGYVFQLTKAYTGMRLGEMFGLRRDFMAGNWPASEEDDEIREDATARYCGKDPMDVLRVQWQYKYVKDPEHLDRPGVPALALPKYGSVRTLVIPPFLAELHVKLLESHDSEWAFPAMDGGNLLTTDFHSYYWKPVRDGSPARRGRYQRPKLPAVESFTRKRIHLIRHAHGPHLEEDGVPDIAIEERLGHVVQGVRGVYRTVTPKTERQIRDVLQKRWNRERPKRG
ncbi:MULTISPECIES: integrase [unclassified Streptomyces]|uniref:integrase n=1 Tax=unclassified Streptomyces TaxID=2593676 RepID=UPI0036F06525